MPPLIHLISESDWAGAQREGVWRPPSLAAEGFIHCSRPEQVAATIRRHFPGRTDMLMLVLDPARITAEIRDEDLYGRGETFPHIYGPLNLDAVMDVRMAESESQNKSPAPPAVIHYATKKQDKAVWTWASNRLLDRVHPVIALQTGWTVMLFACVASVVTLANVVDYNSVLLQALGLMILADTCLVNCAARTRGLLHGLAWLGMLPSVLVLLEFVTRFRLFG